MTLVGSLIKFTSLLIFCKQCFKLLGMAIGRGKQVTICIPNYNSFFVLFVNSFDK